MKESYTYELKSLDVQLRDPVDNRVYGVKGLGSEEVVGATPRIVLSRSLMQAVVPDIDQAKFAVALGLRIRDGNDIALLTTTEAAFLGQVINAMEWPSWFRVAVFDCIVNSPEEKENSRGNPKS